VDPVAVSKHGHSLLRPGAGDSLRDTLLPLATVVTPNLDEAEQLSGTKAVDEDSMLAVARAIKALGPQYVLIKGGHLAGDPVDLLFDGERTWRYAGERIDTPHTHGTGCTLASAIASYLARGEDVPAAVAQARDYVTGAIRGAFPLGSGIGPVDHAWQSRS
jgi:hydroxymethylpyrimidine/phosphomethylpyrimidine kinase